MIRRFSYFKLPVIFVRSGDELKQKCQSLTSPYFVVCQCGYLLHDNFVDQLRSVSEMSTYLSEDKECFFLKRDDHLSGSSPKTTSQLFLLENSNNRVGYLNADISQFRLANVIFEAYLSTTELLKCHFLVNQNFLISYPEWIDLIEVEIGDYTLPLYLSKGGYGKMNHSIWFNIPPELHGKQKVTISCSYTEEKYTFFLDIPQLEYLAVTTLLKDEEDFLEEWIEHYLILGASRFYIFDNFTGNRKKLKSICEKYPQVTLIDFCLEKDIPLVPFRDGHNYYPQSEHINLVISKYGGKHKWLILCDVDEFLIIEQKTDLTHFLLTCNDPFLSIETYSFGCRRDEGSSVIKSHQYRKPKSEGEGFRTKCIIDPRKVSLMDVHLAVTYFGQRRHVSPDVLNFRHYMYRVKDVIEKRTCPHGDLDSFHIA